MGFRVMAILIVSVHGLLAPLVVMSLILHNEIFDQSSRSAPTVASATIDPALPQAPRSDPSPQPAEYSEPQDEPIPEEWIAIAHVRRENLETFVNELVGVGLEGLTTKAREENASSTIISASAVDQGSSMLEVSMKRDGRMGRVIIMVDEGRLSI